MRDLTKKKDSLARISGLRGCALILSLGLVFLLAGCQEPEVLSKAGQPFAEEKAPPFLKAVVYIYRPPGEKGRPRQLGAGACDGPQGEILPGGYTSLVVNPGARCFRAERTWASTDSSSVNEILGQVKLNLQPGSAAFLRLERGKGFFMPSFVLRTIPPEAAKLEIGKCRQTIPMSTDEMLQAMKKSSRR